MKTELTIGAINPGYGGLPIGVAAALGGAQLAWHAHPGQPFDYAGRMIMRYHHPRAGAYTGFDTLPPMVDVLTINGFSDWLTTGRALIGGGYKPPLAIVEVQLPNDEAVPICDHLASHGYRTVWPCLCSNAVGAPHRRLRTYAIGVRNDIDVPTVNAAYLDTAPWTGTLWTSPSAYCTHLDSEAYRWTQDDMEGHADKALTRALEHWEKVTGERYPYPIYSLPTTMTGGRLSIGFVEWMMGLPVGYVSTPSLHLSHDDRMGLIYSGTVPLQAAHAVAVGLTQMGEQ
jgi:DNA (cytosine-5)-methyltransferase 1|nr:MAG TPA: Cytosine specific methyltransferase [Caudoviricetes sp.]